MNFETYQLDITESVGGKSIFLKPIGSHEKKALEDGRRKIYIICNAQTVLYVGEASTSLKLRFQRGLYAYNYYKKHDTARNGYKGYKWLDDDYNSCNSLTVYVVVFDGSYDNHRNKIEAIEGELVYEIRNKTNKWPSCQNEIHFSNIISANDKAKEILKVFDL